MNKSLLAGVGIGIAAASGIAAVAGLDVFSSSPKYAQVVTASPINKTIKTPRQECRTVAVTHRRPVQDENKIAGSVLGAVAGGVLGHQFGGGRGRDVATVAGALAGGMRAIRCRVICKIEIPIPPTVSVARRSMINRKNCWAMTSRTKLAISRAKSVWTTIRARKSRWIATANWC